RAPTCSSRASPPSLRAVGSASPSSRASSAITTGPSRPTARRATGPPSVSGCPSRPRARSPHMASILIVDDEANIRSSLAGALGREGYQTDVAATLAEAKAKVREAYDFILLDVRLPDGSGLDLLSEVMSAAPETAVIMMSGHATIDDAVRATRLGAFDFLEKPVSLERLLVLLRNASSRV